MAGAKERREVMDRILRASLAALFLVVLASVAGAQTTAIELGTPASALWNGPTNETAAGVDNYQVRWNGGTWAPAGVTVPAAEYRFPIPLSWLVLGTHTIEVRACAGSTCGVDVAGVTFQVVRPLPGRPRNERVVPVPVNLALTIPQAIDRAHAYGLLILNRRLSDGELGILAARHPPTAPTWVTVTRLLDEAFAEFVVR